MLAIEFEKAMMSVENTLDIESGHDVPTFTKDLYARGNIYDINNLIKIIKVKW